eukprot:CCRYP_012093-RA/>CCRYP_012093-RA protein AED:0.41 eAED:0.41 QI:0/-1/0/1/-1/1/1/0/61
MKFIRRAVTDRQEQRDQNDYRIQSKTNRHLRDTRCMQGLARTTQQRMEDEWRCRGRKGMGR